MAGKVIVEIQHATSAHAPDDALLRAAAEAALAGRAENAELCIRIVGEAESAALNERYRGKSGPTNVLSFPCDAEVPGVKPLGDLAICAPVAAAEAVAQGKTLETHWSHLVVHGVLHLLGFDHIGDHDAETMETEERAILARLGYSDPYAPQPGGNSTRL
jgi:probable rRNA maturation factor